MSAGHAHGASGAGVPGRSQAQLDHARANAARWIGGRRRSAVLLAEALGRLGGSCPDYLRAVAEARIAAPDVPWQEVGEALGLTRQAAYAAAGRLLALAGGTLAAEAQAEAGPGWAARWAARSAQGGPPPARQAGPGRQKCCRAPRPDHFATCEQVPLPPGGAT